MSCGTTSAGGGECSHGEATVRRRHSRRRHYRPLHRHAPDAAIPRPQGRGAGKKSPSWRLIRPVTTAASYTPESTTVPVPTRPIFCVAGVQKLIDFCDENEIEYERCGKVIVATDESELGRLDNLYERGVANGVEGLEVIGPGAPSRDRASRRGHPRRSGRQPPASPTIPRWPKPTPTSLPTLAATSSPRLPYRAFSEAEGELPWKPRRARSRRST